MPPKTKKAKRKAPEVVEPAHDASWERTVISGLWDRPITALPDANTWPSWGALRERVLSSCREIRVTAAPSVRDAFASELVKLSPPLLRVLDLSACHNLRNLVLSPQGSCPALESLNLSICPSLETVLVQSNRLTQVDCSNCGSLKKVLLQCPRLHDLRITGCSGLEVVMLWSEELTELDLSGAECMRKLELQCPALNPESSRLPRIPEAPVAVKPTHPSIAAMLRANMVEAATAAAEARERSWKVDAGSCSIPAVFRAMHV